MFSGIIQNLGRITYFKPGVQGLDLGVIPPKSLLRVTLGESISVNGICLTVKEKSKNTLVFFCQKETLSVTTVQSLKVGEIVNLERALKLSDRLGGHIVQGHVDGMAEIDEIITLGESWRFWVRLPNKGFQGLILKGSVTLDGISLTISKLSKTRLAVDVIPHTYKNTNIPLWKKGKRINLEADMIGKYVDAFMKGRK